MMKIRIIMKSKAVKISIGVVVAIIIIASAWLLTMADNKENVERTGERIQNQIQQISLLTSQSLIQFQNISQKQEEGDLKSALDLVTEEKERNKEINNLAMALTEELKELAKLSIRLNSEKERNITEEAIQYQIEAISHLLNYGSGVDIILQELAKKYEDSIEGRETSIKRDMGQLIGLIQDEIRIAEEKSQEFIKAISLISDEK